MDKVWPCVNCDHPMVTKASQANYTRTAVEPRTKCNHMPRVMGNRKNIIQKGCDLSWHPFLVHLATQGLAHGRIRIVVQPDVFTIRDIEQKVIRLHHNTLVASSETSNTPPERISVVPNQFLDHSKYPIIMGVSDGKRCLACGGAGRPVLQLEDRLIMDLYKHPEESKRFTFNSTPLGSTHRFESVAYPGWILCTSQESDKPLGITNHVGESAITEFYFKKILG